MGPFPICFPLLFPALIQQAGEKITSNFPRHQKSHVLNTATYRTSIDAPSPPLVADVGVLARLGFSTLSGKSPPTATFKMRNLGFLVTAVQTRSTPPISAPEIRKFSTPSMNHVTVSPRQPAAVSLLSISTANVPNSPRGNSPVLLFPLYSSQGPP